MKTTPQSIVDGLNNNYERGFIVKICRDISPIWLSTKNIMVISGEAEIPVEYDRLCLKIDEADFYPFSKFRSGMDISSGGGRGYVSDFNLNLLGFDGYHEILEEENIEGRLVIVYLFFIPPGAGYIQISNAMVIGIGSIDSVIFISKSKILVKCTGGDFFRHRIIPDSIITKENYPFAPESNIGKTIPLLYGSFNSADLNFGISNFAPAFCIDENSGEFAFACHECKPDSVGCFYSINKDRFYSKIISDFTYSKNIGCSSVKFIESLCCEVCIQPKRKGTQMDPEYNDSYKYAVDNNPNSSVNVLSEDKFYLKAENTGNIGIPDVYSQDDLWGYFKLCLLLGNVTNGPAGKAAKIKYFINNEFVYLNNYDILETMSNTDISCLFYFPSNMFYEILKNIEIGFTVEPGASVEVKNMFIAFKYRPLNEND